MIDYLEDGAVCRTCIVAANSDPMAMANKHRDLTVSMGRRSLFIGLVMVAIGITVLALGIAGGGSIIVVPIGFLAVGAIEIVRGATKLAG